MIQMKFPKNRRIPYRITKKLRRSYKSNEKGTREYEKAIWQKKKEPSKVEDQR